MKSVVILLLATSMVSFLSPSAFADASCQPIYGGGTTCTAGFVAIEKDVVNPVTNSDVHDLGINDPQFSAGQTATFHITISNTGTAPLTNITVKDIFPQYLTFLGGPGTFDQTNKTLTFQAGDLAAQQSETYTVTGTIFPANQLPNNQSTCVVNQANVSASNNQYSQDGSQFCIQTAAGVGSTTSSPTPAPPQVLSSPATGASGLLLSMLIPLGISGYFIQKIAIGRRRSV